MRRVLTLALAVAAGLIGSLVGPGLAAAQDAPKVLVFSKTAGFRHDSIPSGIAAVRQLGADHGFAVDATEDAAEFTAANLVQYDAVVWLSTTGDVLNTTQEAAFEDYVQAGGGYVGVHAAADTEYGWSWYGGLVGAYFQSHPANQNAKVLVTDREHPSTRDLPADWTRFDEWYNYRASPRQRVHVLAELDESSYSPGSGAMGADHPIAWCHAYDGGRAWYTGMGHTSASYAETDFLEHVLGGIRYAAGIETADCGGPEPAPETCALTGSDEFDGAALDTTLWSSRVRENPATYEVRDGALRITTEVGDLWSGGGNAKNLLLQPAPSGDWQVTTRVTIDATGGSEQAGLLLYAGDDDYIKLNHIGRSGAKWFEFIVETGGSPRFDAALDRTADLPAGFPTTMQLRITSEGGQIRGAYSTDEGGTWTTVGRPAGAGVLANPRIGVFAQTNEAQYATAAAFDWFHLDGATGEDTTPPAVCAEVDGLPTSDGRYLDAATVAIAASDFGSGVDTVQYAIGGGDWQPYDGPFELDAGEHTVRHRATDLAGNVSSEGTTTVTVVGDLGCEPAAPAGPGYVPIFDGTVGSLDGWRMAGPGGFDANADCTIDAWGGMGLLWHAAQELDSAYTVRAEWKIYGDDDNSGMFIGFPDPGDDPWQPVSHGYEIQIDPTDEPVRTTGAVYSFQAPDEVARAAALRPYGEWNVMEVSVDGTQITIRLNGTVINEYTSPHPERSPMTGFVGIQNDGAGRDVTYRSVQLRDDSPPPADPITPPADPPFGSPPGGNSPPPLVDEPAAYRLSGAARRVTKGRFARRGLRLQLRSSEAARGTARVVVSRRVARRLGLARRVLASRGVQFTGAGSRTLRVKPGRAMARRLGRARGVVPMTLEITLRDAGGEATTITRRVTLN